jgi:N-sulfoglucosamine sulfohydrolase
VLIAFTIHFIMSFNYKIILSTALGIASMTAVLHAQQRPNIVYIMADDLTYSDIGCYGGINSITPNIDQLAEEGMRFLNCHQAAPMCSPTRQNLLTGLYPVRNGAYPNHSQVYEDVKSIAHYLADLGYNVGLQGKRHFGPLESFPFDFFNSRKIDIDTSLFSSFIAENVRNDTPFALFLMSNHPHGNSFARELGDESLFDADKLVLPPHFIDTPVTREKYVKYLADNPQYAEIKRHLKAKLTEWMKQQGDEGQETELRALERSLRD